MDSNKKNNLLNRKSDVLKEMLNITKNVDLSDETLIVDNYTNMVEKREHLMVQLQEIDNALNELPESGKASSEGEGLLKKIEELVLEIVAEDKRLREYIDGFLSSIKESISLINKSKEIKKHYEYDLILADSMGKGFDRSN